MKMLLVLGTKLALRPLEHHQIDGGHENVGQAELDIQFSSD